MISLAKKNNTKGELEVDSFGKGFMRTAAYCVFFEGECWLLSSQESQSCSILGV